MKLLMWTRGGFTIMHKRLERGTFASLRDIDANARCVEIDVGGLPSMREQLATFLDRQAAAPRLERSLMAKTAYAASDWCYEAIQRGRSGGRSRTRV